uniref:Sulfatase domain-containing protein n=3 Tax=Steinernema glaseri TaxID=37863 RepID=A0A1I8A4Q1_9BILA
MLYFLALLVFVIRTSSAVSPNVLLIFADDLGFNDVDWHDRSLRTPFLRSLAFSRHSVQLANSYVNQLCTPTRSALMTGYYPFRTGTQAGVFLYLEPSGVPLEFPFLPLHMKRMGYRTYLVGKWHLGYCRREFLPTARGFDYFYGYYGPQTGYFNHSAEQFDRRRSRTIGGLDLFMELNGGVSAPDYTKQGVYSTNLFADEAINLISYHDVRNPFFLFLSFQSVHAPLQVPPLYENRCSHIGHPMRRKYCAVLAAMDDAIERVVRALKNRGLYENTVIIFSSDNGGATDFGASNAPLRGEKDTLWEGGTKTNTFVHAPRYIRQFAVRNDLFHVVDWHATILGMAGSSAQTYGDGINQWDMIRSGKGALRRFQFVYNIGEHGSAIRQGDFKLIMGNADRTSHFNNDRMRLYRLSVDPAERRDVSRQHFVVARQMARKIMALRRMGRRSIRLPLDPRADPAFHNGAFGSYWC